MLDTLATVGIAAHAGGPWGAGFGWFFLLIPFFWIAVIALVFFIARRSRRAMFARGFGPGAPWAQPARRAESTLAERFAQGDIDEKEYRARLEVLRANAYPEGAPER
ncbi:putative membrane protein [Conyzicola lurida]|uniref:Putative membrane protein n=1 Tax=Conyzicola lurida TaxID=1172621 RepID=A0A841AHQ3_9MICO|nr:putative membrane protein [Conyzicola lurida]